MRHVQPHQFFLTRSRVGPEPFSYVCCRWRGARKSPPCSESRLTDWTATGPSSGKVCAVRRGHVPSPGPTAASSTVAAPACTNRGFGFAAVALRWAVLRPLSVSRWCPPSCPDRLIRRASHASHATADIRCRLVATTAVPSVCRRSVFASSPGSALSRAPTDLHSWDRRCGFSRSCVALLFPSACGRREHRRAVQLAVRIACLSPLSPQHAGPAAATAPLAGRLPTSNGPPLPCAAVLCRVVPSPLRVDTTGTAALSTPRCPRRAACFSRCPPNTQAPPSPSSGTRPPLCGVTNAWVNPQ